MIVYSRNGNTITVKIISEVDNVPEDADVNRIIAYLLVSLAKRVVDKKERVYDVNEVGVF